MNMASRVKRVEQLLALRERALEGARAALATAQRATAAAITAHTAAEQAWSGRSEQIAGARFTSVVELSDAHAHLRTMRMAADEAAGHVQIARAREDDARAECVRAERERRKLEVWRDKLAALERQAEARRERLATDELAARGTTSRAEVALRRSTRNVS